MKCKCLECEAVNDIPEGESASNYICYSCKKPLHDGGEPDGETSAVVGLIGGAALGASIGGPVGAIIGGIIGGIIGKESKGVG